MNKIYDCFTFFNELDLLELRLEELYDHVDHFVLVEGNRTFQNTPKPFYFEENEPRFARFSDKIIHVKVVDMPEHTDAWGREEHQRNAIKLGLEDANDNDIIIVSDLDEIIRPSTVDSLRNDDANVIWGMRMPLFYFRINHMLTTTDSTYTTWAMACRKKFFTTAEELRKQRFMLNSFALNYNQNGIRMCEHAGWQFSYFGDKTFAQAKIQSFAHVETNRTEVLENIDIERSIANGDGLGPNPVERFASVQIDDYFPRTIRDNLNRWSHYIVSDPKHSVYDFLPI
jgi:hypothetical protein